MQFLKPATLLPDFNQIDDHNYTTIIEENTKPQSYLFDNPFSKHRSHNVSWWVMYFGKKWPTWGFYSVTYHAILKAYVLSRIELAQADKLTAIFILDKRDF